MIQKNRNAIEKVHIFLIASIIYEKHSDLFNTGTVCYFELLLYVLF